LFWPVALSLTGALAVVLLLAPLAKMLAHGSTNYNEGWNAYHQQEAIQGKPLYGAPPGFVCTNYPPISFHLIGLASRVAGDVNQTGRWVSLLSLLLVAILCGSIVRLCTGSAPLAAYTALSVVIWLTVYLGNRIGMNDPQLLGTVFSLFGLYVYIRHPEKLGWLSISAAAFTISVFTKHNLLAFPAAVGLHLLLGGKWKRLAVWSGVVAGGSVLLVGLTRWVDGPYFVANILMPRTQTSWLENVTDYATLFQVPLAIALVWSLRHMGRSLTHIMALVVIVANVVAVAFAGGDGVDKNIFFDSLFSLAIVGALVFSEYAPLAAGWKSRGFLLTVLLTAPSFGVLIQIPTTLRGDRTKLRSIGDRARDFDSAVTLLRSRPGPALCEDLLLCFEAGKPYTYDAFVMKDMVKLGRVKEDDLVKLLEDGGISTVQLNGGYVTQGERLRFTASFMKALLNRYRVEKQLSGYVVMVPKE
jgi:hypothetical protein